MGGKSWFIILIVCMLLEILIDQAGLPGYLFMVLFYSLLIFSKADKIMQMATSTKTKLLFVLLLTTNLAAVYACHNWYEGLLLSLQRWICYMAGFIWLLLLLHYGENIKSNFCVMFLSVNSYELYL